MDLFNLAKIVEVSPIIALTVIFSWVLYKVGTAYISFVNKILEKYSGDVQDLKTAIEEYQRESRDAHENITGKIDNFRQMVTQEFQATEDEDEEGHKEVLKRIDELRLEVLRSQIENKSKRDKGDG